MTQNPATSGVARASAGSLMPMRSRDQPCCCPDEGSEGISLRPDELELLRLVDLEGLEQEEAAARLGVSRKTAWRDLHEARRKISDALVFGKGIEIAGCQKAVQGQCPKCPIRHNKDENDDMSPV